MRLFQMTRTDQQFHGANQSNGSLRDRIARFNEREFQQGAIGCVFLQGLETFVNSNVTRSVPISYRRYPFQANQGLIKLMEMKSNLC